MKFAYADPPYPGMARRFYKDDPQCAEVDHKGLVESLCADYDAWALSTGSVQLKQVLALCPDNVRVCAWVKPLVFFKPGVKLAYAWEPVILWRPRRRPKSADTLRDWCKANAAFGKGLTGAKPEELCWWVFEALGMTPEDEFHDLFPGTGAVSRAHERWKRARTILPLFEGAV